MKLIGQLFLPYGFLPVLAVGYLIFGGFDLAGKMGSGNIYYKTIDFHYMSGIIPFVTISFVFGLKKYLEILDKKKVRRWLGLMPIFGMWFFSFWMWSPLTSSHLGLKVKGILYRREEVDFIEREVKKGVEDEASVCATNNLGAQFSARRELFMFPSFCEGSDYVLIYEGYSDMVGGETVDKEIEKYSQRDDYKVRWEFGDFIGFKKIK